MTWPPSTRGAPGARAGSTARSGTTGRRSTGPGERDWALAPGEETWGMFNVPESEVAPAAGRPGGPRRDRARLRDRLRVGLDGAARGAAGRGSTTRSRQLETAARLQAEHGIDVPADPRQRRARPAARRARSTSRSASTGRRLWADPYAWLPEAARLLRPGGRLHVLTNHLLSMVATAEDAGEDDQLEEGSPGLFGDTGRSGPTARAWSSTSRMATGSACSAPRASRSTSWSSCARPRVPRPASLGAGGVGPAWPFEEVWKVRRRG